MDLLQRFEKVKAEYQRLKAEYKELLQKVIKANEKWEKLLEEGKITEEEWAEKTTETEFNMGLDDLTRKLWAVEDLLITLGREIIFNYMSLPTEKKQELETVFNCKFTTIKEKVADILLKLDTSELT